MYSTLKEGSITPQSLSVAVHSDFLAKRTDSMGKEGREKSSFMVEKADKVISAQGSRSTSAAISHVDSMKP